MNDARSKAAPLPLEQNVRTPETRVDRKAVGKRVRRNPRRAGRTRVVGYATVPVDIASITDALREQSETIALTCAERGLSLLQIVHDREPRGRNVLDRPALGYALARIAANEADGMVVADLARLTHSVPQLGRVLEWFVDSDARLIAATPDLDTEEQAGRLAVQAIVDLSKQERDWLIERTREGMRAARRKGPPAVADFPEVRARIVAMRADGMTLQAIADRLNAEDVPTVRGGARWRPSSVQAAAGYRRPRVPSVSGFLAAGANGSNGPAVTTVARDRVTAVARRFGDV